MHASTLHGVLEHLRKLTDPARVRELSDADLLERFRLRREEAAFTLLVQRHGPMVLAACRRILGDAHEAEDVFQATFLVLVRKAATIRKEASLSSWLHVVATHLAQRARAQSARRQAREREVAPLTESDDSFAALAAAELRAALDEEIERLPAKYRLPLVLCYLADKTHEQAAHELGCPKSSVTARLAKARELLQRRLRRRGFTAPAGLLAALLTQQTVSAAVPSLLTLSTVRLAVQARAAEKLTATTATVLADGFVKGATVAKYTTALTLLTAISVFAVLGTWMASSPLPSPPQKAPSPTQYLGDSTGPRVQIDKPRVDRFGDVLPEGAVARLGTVRFRQGGRIYSLAFAPDGKTLASGGWDNAVRLWDVATGKEIRRFTPAKGRGAENLWVASVAFSGDGKHVAAGTGNASSHLVLWELATGREVRRFQGARRSLTSIAFTPDGKTLAASDVGGAIRLWSVGDGEVIREFKGHQDRVEAIAFAPDGKSLASAGRDKTIRLWDVTRGRELRQLKGHIDSVQTIAFARDGKKLASGGHDKTIRLWNPADGKELLVLKGHDTPVCSLAFFPDGKRLASGSDDWDRGIRFWDTDSGKELTQIRGPQETVSALAISSDGKTLAFDSRNRTVRIWDVVKDVERHPTNGSQGGLWFVAFSQDGKSVATGGEDETVRLWDSSTGIERLVIVHRSVWPERLFLLLYLAWTGCRCHRKASSRERLRTFAPTSSSCMPSLPTCTHGLAT